MISIGRHFLLHESGVKMPVNITVVREEPVKTLARGEVQGQPSLWVGQTVDIAGTDVRAIVTRINIECDVHDVTLGGSESGFTKPDQRRQFIPGMRSAWIELLLMKEE